jgi:hypothetical protein
LADAASSVPQAIALPYWFNLDATWAFSLILVGALSLAINPASRH